MSAYTLKVEALNEFLSFLSHFPQDFAQDEAIDLLLGNLDHQSLKLSILDKELVHRVATLLLEAEFATGVDEIPNCSISYSALRIIDAFIVSKFHYDLVKKDFYEHTGRIRIHGDASSKATLYRDRFLLLLQRLSRDPDFSRLAFDRERSQFGSCEVKICGFPPLEDRDKSILAFPGLDFFGSGPLTKEKTLRLADIEKRVVNDMFIVMSDIWVDNEEIMGKLETVLDGYENVEVVPSLFVFMGNFYSHPCNLSYNSFSSLGVQFGNLGHMISSHPRLMEQSRFLLIPDLDDPGPSTVLSRCALPKYVTEEFQMQVPNAIFSSNPCRVKFCTHLLYKMHRSCLITIDPFEHLVVTITHQSHLCPLPLSVQPIIWNYDHCLHLYPAPHTIVLSDRSEQKS